jgi:single-strand DNA-binding protein
VRSTVTLSGNLTSDVTLRGTSGGPVAGFRMACTETWWDKKNERWAERVTYLQVSAWRQLAEHVADSLAKGQPVIVVGKLRQREYEDRDGVRRTVIDVEADTVGHDLTRGRARFERRPRGPQTAEIAALEEAYAQPPAATEAGASTGGASAA